MFHISRLNSSRYESSNENHSSNDDDVALFMFPWCRLCKADIETITLIEKSFEEGQGIKASCKFFTDILIKDFPPDIFLNRPLIVKSLFMFLDSDEYKETAIEVLTSFCDALLYRIRQYFDSDIKTLKGYKNIKLSEDDYIYYINNLEKDDIISSKSLDQMPLPYFCLDLLQSLLSKYGQNIFPNNIYNISMNEMNKVFSLCYKLLKILTTVVKDSIWSAHTLNNSFQHIIEKTLSTMRICSDLLIKYWEGFHTQDKYNAFYRVNNISILVILIKLVKWSQCSQLIPAIAVEAMSQAIQDVSLNTLYPQIYNQLFEILKNIENKSLDCSKTLKLHNDIERICKSFDSTINFLKHFNQLQDTPNVILLIKKSILSFEFYGNTNMVKMFLNIISQETFTCSTINSESMQNVRYVVLDFLTNENMDIQQTGYKTIYNIVTSVLGGHIRSDSEQSNIDEKSLMFLLDPHILMEIVSYGINSEDCEISNYAQKIISLILRAKLLLSNNLWSTVLGALLPSLPILHAAASFDNDFGSYFTQFKFATISLMTEMVTNLNCHNSVRCSPYYVCFTFISTGKSVTKTLDIEIGKCMLIPHIELVKGNIRLLYTKCLTANMEGSANLVKYLILQRDNECLLPVNDSLRADMLCSLMKTTLSAQNFNINKAKEQFYTESSMRQVLTILDIKNTHNAEIMPDIDPSFKRSALSQLAVMLQQKSLQKIFLIEMGCELIVFYLKSSLTSTEFTIFPESAKSCINILNSICCYNASIRQWAGQNTDLILNILRAMLLFPNDADFLKTASQVLCLTVFSEFTMNSCNESDEACIIAVHNSIVQNTMLPINCNSYSKTSPHKRTSIKDLIMRNTIAQKYIRVSWCISWFKGADNITRWPYIVDDLFPKEYFTNDLILKDTDLYDLKITCPVQGSLECLYQIQNAVSHSNVLDSLHMLSGYISISRESGNDLNNFSSLPWCTSFKRFLESPPITGTDYTLLWNILNFMVTYHQIHTKTYENSFLNYMVDTLNNPFGLVSILESEDSQATFISKFDDKTLLKRSLLQCIKSIFKTFISNNIDYVGFDEFCNDMFCLLCKNLRHVDIENSYSLAYIEQILDCLSSLTFVLNSGNFEISHQGIINELMEVLLKLLSISHMGKDYSGYKGCALVQNCFTILNHLSNIYIDINRNKPCENVWYFDSFEENLFSICLSWQQNHHIIIRSLALKLLSGLCFCTSLINKIDPDLLDTVFKLALRNLTDLNEAIVIRTEAGTLLYNILINKRTASKELIHYKNTLKVHNIIANLSISLNNIISEKENNFLIGENISPSILKDKGCFEVSLSKNSSLRLSSMPITKCLPMQYSDLIIVIADVIYSTIIINDCLPDNLFESDIIHILFSCLSLENGSKKSYKVKGSVGRVLYIMSKYSQEAVSVLINNNSLMMKLFGFISKELKYVRSNDIEATDAFCFGWKWILYLAGSLITPINGFKMLLSTILEDDLINLFNNLLLIISTNDFLDMASSALFCLTSIFNNIHYCNDDTKITIDLISLLDKTVIPPIVFSHEIKGNKNAYFNKDIAVLSEHFCYALMNINKLFILSSHFSVDIGFNLNHTSSCTAGLLGCSEKAKYLAINMKFIQDQVLCLRNIQYALTPETLKSVLKEKSHPIIHYLNAIFQNLNNIMTNCPEAKEMCVDLNILVPIKKMWDLCIVKKKTRLLVIEMLATLTNYCLKGCNLMCHFMGSTSILKEICDLISKEMNLVSRVHSLDTLKGCFRILENVAFHQHCRMFILKSDIFDHLNKIHPALTKRQEQWKEIELIWESFALVISKYPDGQTKLSEYFPIHCVLAHQADFIMLPVLRNCSFNSTIKSKFLQSPDILLLFSDILEADDSIDAKIIVATTLWALASNNSKIKSSLRSMGLTAKLQDCLRRLKYTSNVCEDTEKALEIISHITKAIV